MRPPADASRIEQLARRLSRVAHGPVRVYLTGGATAVLEGWRKSTLDVDLRIEPESDEILRELVRLSTVRRSNVASTPS